MNRKSKTPIYPKLEAARNSQQKKFAVLIDPDKVRIGKMDQVLQSAIDAEVDYFFIGGSLIVNNMLDNCLDLIAKSCQIPIVLFPGSSFQLSYKADAILFLSLISGRNPELLIGNHVIAAPYLKMSPLEIIPTGYMLIDGGVDTTVSYISNTKPIPANKEDIAVCTAAAGEMLGLKLIYLDAGSGAIRPVTNHMIRQVSDTINVPLIVGGGISSPEIALQKAQAGADLVVIGNAIEKNPILIKEVASALHEFKPEPVF